MGRKGDVEEGPRGGLGCQEPDAVHEFIGYPGVLMRDCDLLELKACGQDLQCLGYEAAGPQKILVCRVRVPLGDDLPQVLEGGECLHGSKICLPDPGQGYPLRKSSWISTSYF
ncbi:MAG: hypothetical protein ACMUIM_01620 [bacterium]